MPPNGIKHIHTYKMQSKKKPKLWTGSFVKICLVNFFVFVNFHALLPTFPFFVSHLGGDAVAIGVATALFSLTAIISRPFLGWLTDTRGRRTMLVVGLVGMAAIPMGYFISSGIAMAVLLRTAHGAFHASSSNATATWVTDIIPPKRMGEGLGMYGLSMAVSTAVAPALGLAVMNALGFRSLFMLAAVAALLALFLGLSIKSRNYRLSSEPLRVKELFEPLAVPASVTQFFFMVSYGVVEVYVAIYASTCHLPSGGLYFISVAVATVATRFVLGRYIDRYGEANLVYTGNGAIIAGIVLLVLCHNTPCYVLSALLLGYSFGAIQPSLQTMAMHAVPQERRGAASSTFFVAFDLGIALGGFAAGVLVKHLGYDMMFLIISISCVVSAVYYVAVARKHPSSFNPSIRRCRQQVSQPCGEAGPLPLVITISRQYGSGGHHIGELLAKQMGVKLYDKELITLTARRSGLSELTVADTEQAVDGRMAYESDMQTAIFQAQRQVITDIAQREPCVIVGRLANFILAGRPNCLHVFVYASPNYRIRRMTQEYGVPEAEAAEIMARADQERAEHCRHFTGQTWGACNAYDMLVNSACCGVEGTAALIRQMAEGRGRSA